MKTARRFVNDESGMTMALAIIMILLIGVMGAGLLTFVSRDLNTEIEENRGQRAFEMADAGINAAKRQLFSDCGAATDCQKYYNDSNSTTFVGDEDKRWSKAKGGLTLNNLDGEAGTTDSAIVEIQFTGSGPNPYNFTVTSTGNYGSAKRKIEAKLKGVGGVGGGGNNIVNPGYYTMSDILIEGAFETAGVSLFTTEDIIIKGLTPKTRLGFQADASTNAGGVLRGADSQDPLDDWYSPNLIPPDNWNLIKREKEPPSNQSYTKVGMAAAVKICSPTNAAQNTCLGTDPSVADRMYGYDSTTGDLTDPTLTNPSLKSNLLRFYTKDPPCTPAGECPVPNPNQPSDTITYPFPRLTPDPSRLKDLAEDNPDGSTYWACPSAAPSTCTPPWSTTLFPNSAPDDQVVFVDAKGNNLNLDIGNNSTGVLVAWCGSLTPASPFKGILINMTGNGSSFGATNCDGDGSKGVITLATASNENLQAWVLSNGGTSTIPGKTFRNNVELKAVPGGGDLASIAFGSNSSPPTSFEVDGWREVYQ